MFAWLLVNKFNLASKTRLNLSYPVIPMCLPTTLFDVLQLLCLINKSTVTLPVETFPSLILVFQDKSFGSVFKMNSTLPFLGFVLLTFPMSYWVCAPTTILVALSSDQAYRCALSWITIAISSCPSIFFFLVCIIIYNTVKFYA